MLDVINHTCQNSIPNHFYENHKIKFFTFLYLNSLWFHFCFELHTLLFNLYLQSLDSCWYRNLVLFTADIKLRHFLFFFFFFFFVDICNTNMTIWIINGGTTSTTLINTNIEWIEKSFIRVYINKSWYSLALVVA